MQTVPRKLPRPLFLLAGLALFAATAALTACGSTIVPVGTGGAAGTGGGGTGGHGGAPAKQCPQTPPNNLDSCEGFALGAQCNYGSSSSGILTSTECQCDGVAGGGLAWSCGSEAVGVGASSSSSSSSG
jgi:hypothetical protein